MKSKFASLLAMTIAVSIIFIVYDWWKFDLIIMTDARAAVIFLTFLVYIFYACFCIFVIGYSVSKINTMGWRRLLPIIIVAFTIFFVFVFPFTNLYLQIYYKFNKEHMAEAVQMIELDDARLRQIGENKYVVPYRFSSHRGVMYKEESSGIMKVEFFVHRGYKLNRIIVYCSDDSSIKQSDFNFDTPYVYRYIDIEKLDNNWYSAISIWQ